MVTGAACGVKDLAADALSDANDCAYSTAFREWVSLSLPECDKV